MGKQEQQNNARVIATKNDKGFIKLELVLDGGSPIVIDVADFNGTRKKQAKAITYAIFCKVNGK